MILNETINIQIEKMHASNFLSFKSINHCNNSNENIARINPLNKTLGFAHIDLKFIYQIY